MSPCRVHIPVSFSLHSVFLTHLCQCQVQYRHCKPHSGPHGSIDWYLSDLSSQRNPE